MPQLIQWQTLWHNLGIADGHEALFQQLMTCYSEAHRYYHTTQHLDECLEQFNEVERLAVHPHEVALALWFHDAIYEVTRSDNEAKSAHWARQCILEAGLPEVMAMRVHDLIIATCHSALPTAPDAQLLVDIDLAILGAATIRFDDYERQIRAEYHWVPDWLFRPKRRAILKAFLDRPTLFNTLYFREHYEVAAQANLQRAIARLG